MHDDLLSDVNDIGLTIELLDAKGRVLTDWKPLQPLRID
jgi:hypothetical protein